MAFADYCEWNMSESNLRNGSGFDTNISGDIDTNINGFDAHGFEPGNLTAAALSDTGEVLSIDASLTPGAPARVLLSLDAPALATGTGEAVLADGEDVALVRASVVDADGRLCTTASHNVTFAILSGPGAVLGVGNGDPSSHEPNVASSRSAYHGLVRAVVQVTVDAVSRGRVQQAFIDMEAAALGVAAPRVQDIVVVATALGLSAGRVVIPVSADVRDSVLAVAQRSVKADIQLG
jgi:hypothetical protein